MALGEGRFDRSDLVMKISLVMTPKKELSAKKTFPSRGRAPRIQLVPLFPAPESTATLEALGRERDKALGRRMVACPLAYGNPCSSAAWVLMPVGG